MGVQIPKMSSLMQAIHDSRGLAYKGCSGLLILTPGRQFLSLLLFLTGT